MAQFRLVACSLRRVPPHDHRELVAHEIGKAPATGQQLRGMYAEIIAEGLPERFAEILRRLDEPTTEMEGP